MATWHSHKSCCQLLIKNKALQTRGVYICVCRGRGGWREESEVGRVGRSRRPETLHSDLGASWPLVIESLGKWRRPTKNVLRITWLKTTIWLCLIKTADFDSHCVSSSSNLNCCPPPPPFCFPHLRLDLFLSNLFPTPLALQRPNLPNSVLQKERRSRRRSQKTKRNMEILHRTVDEREQYYLTTTDWRYPDSILSPFC